jgi:hypothetical protein
MSIYRGLMSFPIGFLAVDDEATGLASAKKSLAPTT